MRFEEAASELANIVKDTFAEAGKDAVVDIAKVKAYGMDLLPKLRAAATEPGFAKVSKAAAHNLMLEAVGYTVEQADATDARIWGVVDGALGVLTKVAGA